METLTMSPATTHSLHYAKQNNNLQLAWREKNPEKEKLLFLVHGNSSASSYYQAVLDDDRFQHYHLVAVDLPGHGHSDPWTAEQYAFPNLAQSLALLLSQQWPGKPVVLAGQSLGSSLVAEMLPFLPTPQGIVLLSPKVFGKAAPMETMVNEHIDTSFMVSDHHTPGDLYPLFGQAVYQQSPDLLDQLVDTHRSTAKGFRPAYLQSLQCGLYSDQVELLKATGVPLLVVFGKQDPATNLHYLDQSGLPFWGGTPHYLEDCGYFIALEAPGALNGLLLEYLEWLEYPEWLE